MSSSYVSTPGDCKFGRAQNEINEGKSGQQSSVLVPGCTNAEQTSSKQTRLTRCELSGASRGNYLEAGTRGLRQFQTL